MKDPKTFNTLRYQESELNVGDHIRINKLVGFIGSNKKVLDLGCLDGTIGRMMMKNDNEVYGVDASETAVQNAIKKGVKARVGNLEKPLDYPDDTFNAVCAGEIIEHIYDIDLFLSEIHRTLKPEGILALSTPNLASFGRRLLLLFNRNPHIEISYSGQAAGHIRYFVRGTLEAILRKHKFAIEHFTTDVINFNSSGSLNWVKLAQILPTFGRSLIIKATKRSMPAAF